MSNDEKKIEELIKDLNSNDADKATCAALELGKFPTQKAINALIEALGSMNQQAACFACMSLKKIGKPAVNSLMEVHVGKRSIGNAITSYLAQKWVNKALEEI